MKDNKIEEKMKKTVRDYKQRIFAYVNQNSYRVPFGSTGHFCRGSNSHLLKNGIIFYYLYKWDKDEKDLNTAKRTLDYVMGLNAVDKAMYTGYNTKTLIYHHIWGDFNPGNLKY